MQEVCRPLLGKKPCSKQGELLANKWLAERSCLHSLYKGECVHRGPAPPVSNSQWFLGGKTHPKVLCPYARETMNSPTFQDNYTRRLYLQDYLWKVPVMIPGLGRCSRKFVDGILSPGGKGNWLLFTSIQKSQSNRYPSGIFINNDPLSPEQCWWKGSSL